MWNNAIHIVARGATYLTTTIIYTIIFSLLWNFDVHQVCGQIMIDWQIQRCETRDSLYLMSLSKWVSDTLKVGFHGGGVKNPSPTKVTQKSQRAGYKGLIGKGKVYFVPYLEWFSLLGEINIKGRQMWSIIYPSYGNKFVTSMLLIISVARVIISKGYNT